MAHAEWCGNRCSECDYSYECWMDRSLPCSPDCEYLGEDGYPIDLKECHKAGCDAVTEEIETMDVM